MRLADVGRVRPREVRAVVARDVGVVVREVRADQLAVDALEVVVGLAVGRDGEVEVAGAHAERAQAGADELVGAVEAVGREDRLGLRAVRLYDLEPRDVLAGSLVMDDVRAVHHRGGVERVARLVGARRDDQALVLPVHEVRRAVAAHAPVPDARRAVGGLGAVCLLLVLAVPVVDPVLEEDGAAMRLDALAFGVEPGSAGKDLRVHLVGVVCFGQDGAWPSGLASRLGAEGGWAGGFGIVVKWMFV